ncbi:MAG: glucose-1-phosphate adenylyltransferase [Pseudomonadota bacterium]|nr:glucose-1-phosphate adenylyltransferase [Pseudomonadota bacterium]
MDFDKDPRFVSRLTRRTLALILAGGRGSRLYELTDWRAKPSVHFGGKFRIIDFPLSNCVNSGIRRIGVLTQYKAHSLIRHLVNGWSRFQGELGEFVEILPASQRVDESQWYAGTADAVYQNLDIIRTHNPDYVLILSGDHIYKMDYGPMLAYHVARGAEMTVSCLEVPIEEAAGAFGVLTVDDNHRVLRFDEKPRNPTPIPGNDRLCLASMGNYVFSTQFLYDQLIKDADKADSKHDFGHSIIPNIIGEGRGLYAYSFRDPRSGRQAYWRDVGTVDAFWEANLELVDVSPELNLYDADWPILTYQAQLPPAKFVFEDGDRRGMAINSMVSGGCVISGGQLYHSLLFSNCKVHSYARVQDSVLLPDVDVGRHCRIRRAVIDRGSKIPQGMVIGEDPEEDAKRFRVTAKGVVLVTPEMLGQSLHFIR